MERKWLFYWFFAVLVSLFFVRSAGAGNSAPSPQPTPTPTASPVPSPSPTPTTSTSWLYAAHRSLSFATVVREQTL
jgi:hypothetical protein